MMKEPQVKVISKFPNGTSIIFNKLALDIINTNEIIILLQPQGFKIKLPGLTNQKTHKISKSGTIGIQTISNEYIGDYSLYKEDDTSFKLVKINNVINGEE